MKKFLLLLSIVWILSAAAILAYYYVMDSASKEFNFTKKPVRRIVVTFDDLPAARGDYNIFKEVTVSLINTLVKEKIPAIGFVNEHKLYWYDDPEPFIDLLKVWIENKLELGNHGFNHLDPNTVDIQTYTDDILKGEEVTRRIMNEAGQTLRYYRHPYLRLGPTPEYEQQLNNFLAENGYKIAPITANNFEWKYSAVYFWAKNREDADKMDRIGKSYVKYMEKVLIYWEDLSKILTGQEIPQVLLLHANMINADYLKDIVEMIRKRDYSFITLDEALQDPSYYLKRKFTEDGDSWIVRWLAARGIEPEPSPEVEEFVSDLFDVLSESENPQY